MQPQPQDVKCRHSTAHAPFRSYVNYRVIAPQEQRFLPTHGFRHVAAGRNKFEVGKVVLEDRWKGVFQSIEQHCTAKRSSTKLHIPLRYCSYVVAK